ncbi:hypothetical protein [Adhaeribacter pallidiroseus]|uniref:Uncharacterized protein n=1 Tax=Adhaeribacter pallidiroseus TaxID=2072847 RepID=A0A369QBI8_9BACT|nr:hypothetical protein [Adhaeribacter pallidiroseus]RDC62074.1 hypothetical protein AHMF7616_00665 [Adhaeribacter pallidiroseus]
MKTLGISSVTLSAILTIIATTNWEKLGYIGQLAIIFGIIGTIITAYYSYKQVEKENLLEKINSKIGDIVDLKGKATIPLLMVGDSGTIFSIANGIPFSDINGPLIKITIKDNKLYVDSIIRSNKGDVIAALHNNTWSLYSSDYEYNNEALVLN